MSAAREYGIEKLTDYQHLRLRTEMYLGSRTNHTQYVPIHTAVGTSIIQLTWVPALLTSFREIIDNSLDEFTKAGINGILEVKYNEEYLVFEISDNGRGIPIDWDTTHNCNIASLVMSELKAGRNFNDSDRKGVAGMNGLGGSAVVNLSSSFEMEVRRTGFPLQSGKTNYTGNWQFNQTFKEGSEFDDTLQIHSPKIKQISGNKSGTTSRFQLSSSVFKIRNLPTILIESLLREIAAANPQHKITFNGNKIPSTTSIDKTLFKGKRVVELRIAEEGFNSFFYVVPNMSTPETGVVMHSLVNNIPTYDGGNHLDTFKVNFALRLIKVLEKESKKRKLKLNRLDIEEGLLIYNNTVMDGPFFQGQAKTKLINEEVIKPIDKAISEEWLTLVVKNNREWIDEIFKRCAERTSAKDADEIDKEARKNLKKKVAKLRDATGKRGNTTISRTNCVLFISEGDCIHEDTEVYVLRDGEFIDVMAKDLVIGDVVLTDKNNLKPITGITKKVKPLRLIKTSSGEIRVTADHRLYVLDDNDTFIYKKVKDIVPGKDRLVRSQIVDHEVLDSLVEVSRTNDIDYPYYVETASGKQVKCTAEHKYGVFDFDDMKFVVVEVQYLNIERHALIAK